MSTSSIGSIDDRINVVGTLYITSILSLLSAVRSCSQSFFTCARSSTVLATMALNYSGFLRDRLRGRALEIGVCATASSAFLLFGYDRMLCHRVASISTNSVSRGCHEWYYH